MPLNYDLSWAVNKAIKLAIFVHLCVYLERMRALNYIEYNTKSHFFNFLIQKVSIRSFSPATAKYVRGKRA